MWRISLSARILRNTRKKIKYPMAGIIKRNGDINAGRLQRFGYMTLTAKKDTLIASANESFRAHEFHYWNSDCLVKIMR